MKFEKGKLMLVEQNAVFADMVRYDKDSSIYTVTADYYLTISERLVMV